ncbi:MAG: alkaline phosphatase family protein [Acidimicrobiales bacterium]
MPYLVGVGQRPDALPLDGASARQRVLLVLDGLGWEQLVERAELTPTLQACGGGPITTVAPSTTATALTSLTTGLEPAEHGVVGYRMVVDGEVMNTLRWGSAAWPDARKVAPPEHVQPFDPFLGRDVAMVNKAEFRSSGFSGAHLRGATLTPYRTIATLVHEVARLVREGAPFVYTYYDGVDKVSHEYGFGSVFDAEVVFADRLVAAFLEVLPSGVELIVTADHGQVDCRDGVVPIDDGVLANTRSLSGEGRFRWLHAEPGAGAELLAAATERHAHHAWVRSLEQIEDEHWFGRSLSRAARSRLGDVALCPFEPIAFFDPDDSGPFELVGRHGSLTSAEMYVPLVSAVA